MQRFPHFQKSYNIHQTLGLCMTMINKTGASSLKGTYLALDHYLYNNSHDSFGNHNNTRAVRTAKLSFKQSMPDFFLIHQGL